MIEQLRLLPPPRLHDGRPGSSLDGGAMTPKDVLRFWSKVEARGSDECWNWKGRIQNGYGAFWIDGKHKGAHRVSFLVNKGEIPTGLIVRHSCDNPPCVNPNHLLTGTHKDNTADKLARNRFTRVLGEACRTSILNTAAVIRIRSLRRVVPQKQLAEEYGVTQSEISCVQLRKLWKHVPEAECEVRE